MRTPLLYRLVRVVGRIILNCYFRRVEVSGRENVPAAGPAVFAANHPQSITDALVLGLGMKRTLHFLAHSGLFKNPILGAALRGAGVIPVHRRQDIDSVPDKNVEMFQACREALERAEALAIFPEGVSRYERRLQKMKTGTARIALESEDKNEFELGIRVVPVGISFESRMRFRSRVLLKIGEPIVASEYGEQYRRDPREAVNRFTEDLRRGMAQLIINLERSELDQLVHDVESTYREELLKKPGVDIPGDSAFEKKVALSQEIARAVEYYCDQDPELVWRLQQLQKEYRRKRERLRLSDELLRQSGGPTLKGELVRIGTWSLIGLPLALYGALWNFIPYKLTGWLAKRLAADPTKFHWHQLWVGAVLYTLYYPPFFYVAYKVLGTWKTVAFGASLVPTGFFARWYGRRLTRQRNRIRYAYLAATKGYYLQELRKLRGRVVAEMDAGLEDYLKTRKTGPGESPGPTGKRRE
jgi:1-acyl-sn-glycerol-3-phosphate acyltransferase